MKRLEQKDHGVKIGICYGWSQITTACSKYPAEWIKSGRVGKHRMAYTQDAESQLTPNLSNQTPTSHSASKFTTELWAETTVPSGAFVRCLSVCLTYLNKYRCGMLDSVSRHWATGQLCTSIPFTVQSIKARIMDAKYPDQKIPSREQPMETSCQHHGTTGVFKYEGKRQAHLQEKIKWKRTLSIQNC